MGEDIVLACTRCEKQRRIEVEEARQFNKENPYICFDCREQHKEDTEHEQTRVGQIETLSDQPEEQTIPIFHNPTLVVPIVAADPRSVIVGAPSFTTNDYSPQTEYAKQMMENFRIQREHIDREYSQEQERTHRPSIIPILLPMMVFSIVMVLLFSNISSIMNINCDVLINSTASQAWKTACQNQVSHTQTILSILPILIIIPVILMVIRLL